MASSILRKICLLVALLIGFLISFSVPVSAAYADGIVVSGFSANDHDYKMSALFAEPSSFIVKRQEIGAKDNALDVYLPLPLLIKNSVSDRFAQTSITKVDSRAIVADYKDRPGWGM